MWHCGMWLKNNASAVKGGHLLVNQVSRYLYRMIPSLKENENVQLQMNILKTLSDYTE